MNRRYVSLTECMALQKLLELPIDEAMVEYPVLKVAVEYGRWWMDAMRLTHAEASEDYKAAAAYYD